MKNLSKTLCVLAVAIALSGCAAYVGDGYYHPYYHHYYYGPGAGVYVY